MDQDSFYGRALSNAYCDVIAIQHIPRKLWEGEAELYSTKWFDYRPWHPTKATFYLAECYSQAYGRFMSLSKDSSLIYHRGISRLNMFESKENTTFWRLRQKIDGAGIRYPFFVEHAMKWCFANGLDAPSTPMSYLYQ